MTGTIAYAALAALAVATVGLVPMQDYTIHILVQTASYAIAVFGLTVVLGLCGQINLAQAAFFGFGAYAGRPRHGRPAPELLGRAGDRLAASRW